MTDREKYQAGYLKWLLFAISTAKEAAIDVAEVVFSQEAASFLLWMIIFLTFPVSIPILALVQMVLIKRKLRNMYGHDELMKGPNE